MLLLLLNFPDGAAAAATLLLVSLLLALVLLPRRRPRPRRLTPERRTALPVPASAGARLCAVCNAFALFRCGRCKAVRYCSSKCQIIHWRKGHKQACSAPKVNHHALDQQAQHPDGSTTFKSKANRLHKIFEEMEASLSALKAEEQRSTRRSSGAFRTNPSREADDAARTDARAIEFMHSEELVALKAKLEQVTAERDALSSEVEILRSEIRLLSRP